MGNGDSIINEGLKLIERATELRNTGQLNDAIEIYGQLIALKPASAFYNERGVLFSECGMFEKAIIDLTDGIGLNNLDPDLFVNRGNSYFWCGAFQAAIDDYSKALELSPQEATALNGRGQAFAELGRKDDAINDFQLAMKLNPSYSSPYFNFGVMLYLDGDLSGALDYLNQANIRRPNDANTLCVRGDIFREQGNDELAVQDYKCAVAIQPNQVSALRRLSWIQSTSQNNLVRDTKHALENGKKCCSLTEYRDADCLQVLARAHATTGDYASAAVWQLKAVSLLELNDDVRTAERRLNQYRQGSSPADESELSVPGG